jgi:hypothetical protein
MWPVMIFLVLVVGFYWFAFCLTVAAWLKAIIHLLGGHFTRAAIWLSIGCGMMFWWQGTEVIPHPWDFDAWLRGSAWIVGFGALLTFIRFCHRHRHQQAVQTDTPSLNINVKFSPGWDIGDCEVRGRNGPGHDLVTANQIGRRRPRGAIGTKRSPRITGPTIIDQ